MIEKIMLSVKLLSDPTNIKALLGPFSVPLMRVVWLMLGISLGFILVYLPFPFLGIVFTSGDPVHLTSGNKVYWVESTALLYQRGLLSEEEAKANLEEAGYGPTEVEALAETKADQPEIQQALLGVKDFPSQEAAESYQGKIQKSLWGQIFPLCCLFLLFMIGVVLAIVLSFKAVPIGPWRKGAIATNSQTGAFGAKEIERRKALKEAATHATEGDEEMKVDLGEPIASFMSAYVIGDDLYDDSFALEPDDRFVGECGIGISETIGVGDPKKVTAFEVWVFDQEEIQTLTYVLMSEHAYNDPSLRDKLAPRGEAVMATSGGVFYLDTRKLRLRAKIIDLTYGEGSLPPNSFMEKVTLSLTAWLKEGEAWETGKSPMQLPASQPLSPLPPQNPMGMPPQYGGGVPPQQQPPMGMPPQQPYPPQQQPPMGMPPQQQPYPPQQQPPMGMPPQQQPYPPQQQPPMGMPPQQPYPPQQGGIRPIQPPPQQPGRPLPPPPPGNAPLPGRQAPPTDDPFGDTGQM